MIQVQNVSKSFNKKKILDSISVDIPENKFISFIGSNGAGKSSLLSIITRTLKLDSGDIIIDEKNIKDWNNNELAKKISILSQNNYVNIKLTVKELVTFGRYPHSQGKLTNVDKEKIEDALKYTGMSSLSDRYLDELSGGQKQMAYIAMVIAQDTKYIFLDEPLNNLDMKHSVKIMNILKDLVINKNKTVVVVIHDINYVLNYSDYIIAMKNGKIEIFGDSKNIISNEVLKNIYDFDIKIYQFETKKMCLYY